MPMAVNFPRISGANDYLTVTSDGCTVLTDADAIDKLILNVRELG